MKKVKYMTTVLIIIIIIYSSQEATARFKSVKCSSSNQTLGADYKCFIRAYDRKVAKLSVLVTFEKHCYEALFSFVASYKQTTSRYYRTIINNTVDLCAYFGGTKNILIEWIINVIWKELPRSFLHPCPYFGPFPLHNITINLEFFSNFPDGIYLVHLRFFNKNDSNMLTVDTVFEIKGTNLLNF
ncbi:hypothetical protein PVAND_014935 [Polypedilum vanderplanki]|uniref:Secreted protein n=1 Tax=Polypedilum vanderplanki TaxID=319348 RepID=A0A9J6BB62_POLVA|nr:hypothetical protein PVAND_014935 [Polypedilum vanderplanki]